MNELNLRKLIIYPTNSCQLKCDYCFHLDDNQSMSIDTSNKVIKFAKKNNIEEVMFFGGEPLLNFKVMKHIIEELGEDVIFRFTTNGILLMDGIASYIASKKNVYVQISLDPEDSGRPTKYNNTIIKNIKNFIKLCSNTNKQVEVNSVVNSHNEDKYINEFYNYLKNDLKFDFINHTFLRQDCKSKVWDGLKTEIISDLREGFRPNYCGIDGFINVNHLDKSKISSCFYCYVGKTDLTISPDGKFYACYQFYNHNKFQVGDIDTGIDYNNFKVFNEYLNERKKECYGCEIVNECQSACSYNHFINEGIMGKNSETVCNYRKESFKIGKEIYDGVCDDKTDGKINILFTKKIRHREKFSLFKVNLDLVPKEFKSNMSEYISSIEKFDFSYILVIKKEDFYYINCLDCNKYYKINEYLAMMIEQIQLHNTKKVIRYIEYTISNDDTTKKLLTKSIRLFKNITKVREIQ